MTGKQKYLNSWAIKVLEIAIKSIDNLLEKAAKKLGKKKSQLARELMEQKMYDLELIQKELKEL